jgi:hypothetical protein
MIAFKDFGLFLREGTGGMLVPAGDTYQRVIWFDGN